MTNEDEKIVADYMNWHYAEHEGIYYYDWDGRRQRNLDLNDAGLVVQEMQKRGDIFDFYSYLIDIYNELVEQGTVICGADNFTAWLFIADNFFGAMAAWIKERKK